jgi:hypothetical protein
VPTLGSREGGGAMGASESADRAAVVMMKRLQA